MPDVEQRLRDALNSRAAEVIPDAETWGRVERRVRRQRVYVWAGAGAGLVAAGIAAFAIVSVLRPVSRVQLSREPVTNQPAEGAFVYPGLNDLDPANFPGTAEIGRASCRERV